jgi:thioredoxin 2
MSFSMIRKCPVCGKANRVPAKHLADTGRCGNCKSPLPPTNAPIDVDSAAFDEITREVKVPVLVDFWAPWCGPCRATAPEVEAIAKEMAGKAIVLKVDTEKHPDLGARFRVQAIPYFVVLREGNVVSQRAGAVSRREMRSWLTAAETQHAT